MKPTRFSLVALSLLVGLLFAPGAFARPSHAPPPHSRKPLPPPSVGTGQPVSAANAVTSRNVYLWRQPAKIEPHIQQVDKGRPVQIVGQQSGFYAVVLHNGRRGWLPIDAVRPK